MPGAKAADITWVAHRYGAESSLPRRTLRACLLPGPTPLASRSPSRRPMHTLEALDAAQSAGLLCAAALLQGPAPQHFHRSPGVMLAEGPTHALCRDRVRAVDRDAWSMMARRGGAMVLHGG